MTIRKLRIALLRVAFLPIIFVILFTRQSWSIGELGVFFVEFAGFVLLLAGLALRIWSILYIGGKKSGRLVTDGPYSICRNPLYMGTFLLAVGVGLAFENMLVLALVLIVLVPIHILVALEEEKHLVGLFPEDFPGYKKRVPRFWPKFSIYHSPTEITIPVRAIRRVMIDTLGVLMLPEVEDIIEALHDSGLLPVLWHFHLG